MSVRNWIEVLQTANLRDREADPVSRWLIITRAAVFPMTITSGVIGGLLALRSDGFSWFAFFLALAGLVLAHAANNMINDYFDLSGGVDSADYPRAQYAPHPVLSGMITQERLRNAILAVNAADALIALVLVWMRGWPVMGFALAGLFISVFYVAPPVKLKHIGLGELGVFLVWGPLMTGGTYYAACGEIASWVFAASLPYAIAVTTVLMGKHLDKFEQDRARGIRTLPILLGYPVALQATVGMLLAFYFVVLTLVLTGTVSAWTLLVVLSCGRLKQVLKQYSEPRPESPPAGFPVWPLWYVAGAFYVTKLAGALFILGLLLDFVIPLRVL